MTSSRLPPGVKERLRAALRQHADTWLSRFYRHEILVARAVRGIQDDAAEEFRRTVVRPVVERVAAGMATFQRRGQDVTIATTPELRRLIAEAEALVRQGMRRVQDQARANLGQLVKQEADWVQESARKVLRIETARPVSLPRIEAAVEQRPYLGATTEEWFGSLVGGDNGAVDNVRYAVQTGVQRGLTTDEIVRTLRGTRAGDFEDGLLSGSNVDQLRAMVRTAAAHASATTRAETFADLGVDQYQFVATLDSKTSIICAANDGKVFEMGKGPMPPLHPNCRSSIVPWTGNEVGNRASVDGPVPASTTFPEWLEGQPRSVQDEMLGPTRAAAWRAGDLTFAQMVGKDLQPLSIDRLRQLDRIPDPEDA